MARSYQRRRCWLDIYIGDNIGSRIRMVSITDLKWYHNSDFVDPMYVLDDWREHLAFITIPSVESGEGFSFKRDLERERVAWWDNRETKLGEEFEWSLNLEFYLA